MSNYDVMELGQSVMARANSAITSWKPDATITRTEPLTGGASSLTYLATVEGVAESDRKIVLKVSPPGLEPKLNRDMLRQARVMKALYGNPGVVVPAILFEDAGAPVDVPPFIAMGFVDGECMEPALQRDRDPSRFPEIHARAIDMARVLGAIHQVDPKKSGLADEPVVDTTEEIARWSRAFRTLPDDLQGEWEKAEKALLRTMPKPLPAVINHGDYRLGNTLCVDGRVTAVIDWEIWSLGDPRIDVTWMTFFTDEAQHPAAPTDSKSGMPSPEELRQAYREAGGAPLDDLDWFDALTNYKEAAATGLLIKRERKRGQISEANQRMTPALPRLLEKVHELVG